ncbi:MAG: glycoside hydrolase family protein [Spirulinaceae cyanobacterium SM2_1_0]|nr:glycoside hydrolase family protein [Spirulinaceae cyanobacterium SM2_1_0]
MLVPILLVLTLRVWLVRSPETAFDPMPAQGTPPLVMTGGDPYVRALLRTITASEANDPQPYTLLYGGDRFSDLSRHPERCVTIVNGPNRGNCTTAAGRYQFLDTTWQEKAQEYHPEPSKLLWWRNYSFAPEHQDTVVYRWLSDPSAWQGKDIPALLRAGELDTVLRLLSDTWTSLGYGIETNSMSDRLPEIYELMLAEELAAAEDEASGN